MAPLTIHNTLYVFNDYLFVYAAYPIFTNYSYYATEYHCYLYPLLPIYYFDSVELTVSVSEDVLSLIWYTDGDNITCDTFDRYYHCTNDNKVSDYKRVRSLVCTV